MIKRWFKTTFNLSRQVWSGESSSAIEQGSFLGHIQQGTPENYRENLGFRFTKAYTLWCEIDTDIKEGDRLEEGTNSYDVRFVIDRNIGTNGHLQVILEKNG